MAAAEREAPAERLNGHRAPTPGDGATVDVYDTSLRDGTQGEGVSLTVRDKLRIARRLDEIGVTFIEGGWPGSNPKDAEFFAQARGLAWQSATITAFGATRRAHRRPEEDESLQAILASGAQAACIFGKSWLLHVRDVLRVEPEENLAMIEETVQFLRSSGLRVLYDAEHFFDGFREDPAYALETLHAARRGGAEVVVLCDTNGGSLPWQVEAETRSVVEALQHPVGVHVHDDTGCAVANTIAAVRAGARHVQGTLNGIGERCGNANLSVIIPNLELKLGVRCLPEGRLRELTELARFFAEIANVQLSPQMAYVGRSAFAHKAGVHVAAMRRSPQSYQHVDPAVVGNEMRVLVSELSGRGNVLAKAEELGVEFSGGGERAILEEIKESESRGLSFEAAEASVALLMLRQRGEYAPLFEVLEYQVTLGRRRGSRDFVEATVKVRVGEEILHTVADGSGPVAALDSALRRALLPVFPVLESMHLADYKVRILDGVSGTGAITRVLIDMRDEHGTWSTVGASANIIEASLAALVDALEYGMVKAKTKPTDARSAPESLRALS